MPTPRRLFSALVCIALLALFIAADWSPTRPGGQDKNDDGVPLLEMDAKQLNALIAARPNLAPAYARRATLLQQSGDAKAALENLETAVQLAPDSPDYLSNRAMLYAHFGRDQDAVADLDRALKIAPDHLAALFNRGKLRAQAGQYKTALADFEQGIKLSPADASFYFGRASVREILADIRAVDDWRAFVKFSDDEAQKKQAQERIALWEKSLQEAEPQ